MLRNFDGVETRMTRHQYEQARAAFYLFSKLSSTIDQAQFEECSKMLNLYLPELLQSSYTFYQYIYAVEPLAAQRDAVGQQVKAFAIIDEDGTGALTVQKLLRAARACEMDLCAEEAAEMLKLTGPSVGENEFLRVMDMIQ